MKLVHIDHKLYQANEAYTCPNCNQEISEIVEGETTLLDEGAQVKKTCGHCGHNVVMIFDRMGPVWVKLDICGKKAESIQTCSDRWCKKEFLLQLEMPHIQFDRTEEWHVPISCPYCYTEHWINLYELNEN